MFYVLDKDTFEILATSRFEHAANEIVKKVFGVENCIVRFSPQTNGIEPIPDPSKA